jgi:hypothetical protein
MEGCLTASVKSLKKSTDQFIIEVLRAESRAFEITKSLLNILYNLCVVGSIRLSKRLKDLFRPFSEEVVRLLSEQLTLRIKQQILLQTPALCRLIAEACPKE